MAWLMLDQIPFSLNYLNKTTVEYTSSALQATNEVRYHGDLTIGTMLQPVN